MRRTRVDASTTICVLTRDPRLNIPVPVARARRVHRGDGIRHTQVERSAQLRADVVTEAQLERLSSPVGLNLGARTAAETALSIDAELVAHRRGGTGAPLAGGHRDPPLTSESGDGRTRASGAPDDASAETYETNRLPGETWATQYGDRFCSTEEVGYMSTTRITFTEGDCLKASHQRRPRLALLSRRLGRVRSARLITF